MKKIMFNDKNGLTQAVLEGRKTQTRRIMNPQPEDCSTVHRWYKSAYWKDKPMSLVVNEDGSVYCEFCGYGAPLERTYFYYPIHCECCGSKDENGQKQHFVMVVHCKDCPAPMPKEIHPLLKSMHGEEHRANITNILPTEIRGQFIINDEIIKK